MAKIIVENGDSGSHFDFLKNKGFEDHSHVNHDYHDLKYRTMSDGTKRSHFYHPVHGTRVFTTTNHNGSFSHARIIHKNETHHINNIEDLKDTINDLHNPNSNY